MTGNANDKLVLNITGMTCGHCVMTVRKALESLSGVKEAVVSLDEGKAVVTYDPAQVGAEDMIRKVESVGYGAAQA